MEAAAPRGPRICSGEPRRNAGRTRRPLGCCQHCQAGQGARTTLFSTTFSPVPHPIASVISLRAVSHAANLPTDRRAPASRSPRLIDGRARDFSSQTQGSPAGSSHTAIRLLTFGVGCELTPRLPKAEDQGDLTGKISAKSGEPGAASRRQGPGAALAVSGDARRYVVQYRDGNTTT